MLSKGRRRSQPLLGAPFAPRLFWDGRAATLEEQVLMPIANPVEMAHPVNDTVARLAALDEYRAPFKAAFGDPTPDATALAHALAAFVRTLRPEPSAFDRFLAGDRAALKPLLTPTVMASFEAGIAARETRGETETVEFLFPPRADLEGATVQGDKAVAKVRFLAELRSRVAVLTGQEAPVQCS